MGAHEPGRVRVRLHRRGGGAVLAAALALGCAPVLAAPRIPIPIEVLLGFEPGTSRADKDLIIGRLGVGLVRTVPGIDVDLVLAPALEAVTAAALRARLDADAPLSFVEPNTAGSVAATRRPPARPDDDLWGPLEWRFDRVQAFHAWARWPGRYFTAASRPRRVVRIAVVDTWLDDEHADFRNTGGRSGDVRDGGQLVLGARRDIIDASEQRGPFDWHGTFIAGILGAAADNGLDAAGAAYGAQLVPITAARGDGTITVADAAAGVLAAIRSGARVINLSFAIPGSTSPTLERAIDAAAARNIVLAAAAGNTGRRQDMLPAVLASRHDNLLAVAATSVLDLPASCSSWSDATTISAPGTDLTSLRAGGGTMSVDCGTSAATALVSSAAASMIGAEPGMSAASVRRRLEASADDVDAAGWDARTGAGRLNLDAALTTDRPAVRARGPISARNGHAVVAGVVRSARGVHRIDARLHLAGTERAVVARIGKRTGPRTRFEVIVPTARLPQGAGFVALRAQDLTGRWGPWASATILNDRTAPAIPTVTVDPFVVVPGEPTTTLTLEVADALSHELAVTFEFVSEAGDARIVHHRRVRPGRITLAWRGTVDAPGSRTFDGAALEPGRWTLRVTARDRAGLRSARAAPIVVAADPRIR